MAKPVLAVDDVWKRYGSIVALGGATLRVDEGELFGLLGPNGAGKTTLLSVLAGLLDADSGRVELFGEPFGPADRSRRQLVGLATQDVSIYPELTARENLDFFGRLYGLRGTELSGRVSELLATVGLSDRADDRAGTFSGGMKRRLNLAVSVVHGPKLLLLDEPTTGVDPQSRHHIFDQVRALNAAGMTIVYTSHYMEEVQALCPRIAILDAGVIKACDTLPNLLQRLDAVARFRASGVPPELPEQLEKLPGVKRCTPTPTGFDLVAAELAPVLPKAIAATAAAGVEVTALDLHQPTLERVFLNLTGRGLRD